MSFDEIPDFTAGVFILFHTWYLVPWYGVISYCHADISAAMTCVVRGAYEYIGGRSLYPGSTYSLQLQQVLRSSRYQVSALAFYQPDDAACTPYDEVRKPEMRRV